MRSHFIYIWKKIYNRKYSVEVTAFIFVLLLQIIPVFFTNPLIQYVGGDEVGTISGAAFFAGYDWSETVALHKYYGFGYSIFMTPLFWVFDNVQYIYCGMLVMNGITYALSAAIAANCMKRFCKSKLYIFISAVACVFIPLKFVCVINEHMLILIIWLVCWILMKLDEISDDLSKRNYYSTLLALVLAYSLTVHTRAILIWVAVFCAIVYEYMRKRRIIVSVVPFLCILFLGYLISTGLIKYVQNTLYAPEEGEILANSGDMLAEQLIDNPKYSAINLYSLLSMFVSLIGVLLTGSFVTAGCLLLSLILGVVMLIQYLLHKESTQSYIIIYVFAMVGLLSSLIGQVVLWMPDMQLVEKGNEIEYILGGRIKFYLRYYICYAGPLIMCVLCKLENLAYNKSKKFFAITGAIFFIGIVFMVSLVAPYFVETPIESSPTYYVLKFGSDLFNYAVISRKGIAVSFGVSFLCFIILWGGYKKSKNVLATVVLLIWLVFQCGYICMTEDVPNSEKIYAENGGVAETIRLVSDQTEKTLYIPVKEDKEYRLQFYLYDYKFKYEFPRTIEDNTLIMIRKDDMENTELPNDCYYIDGNNWYLFFASEEIKDIFSEGGYNIEYFFNDF